jgi:predicted dienelactone hydrolase
VKYDPFARGPFHGVVRTIEARDAARDRVFPIELWRSETESGFVVFSHAALQGRRSAAYLCDHLASHGYTVAAMDHSEVVVPAFARPASESEYDKLRRWQAVIDSRVPDVRFLLDHLRPATAQIGIAGHSLGGWTALASAESEPRIRSVAALAPAGASNPKPGILPATLSYARQHDVPSLLLVAEEDTALPLAGMYEIFERTPPPKLMVILRRADHGHFLQNVEELHGGEEAHRFVCALTLAHFDATLRGHPDAQRFLQGDIERTLSARGIEAAVVRHENPDYR